jgi:hypothetical protein
MVSHFIIMNKVQLHNKKDKRNIEKKNHMWYKINVNNFYTIYFFVKIETNFKLKEKSKTINVQSLSHIEHL